MPYVQHGEGPATKDEDDCVEKLVEFGEVEKIDPELDLGGDGVGIGGTEGCAEVVEMGDGCDGMNSAEVHDEGEEREERVVEDGGMGEEGGLEEGVVGDSGEEEECDEVGGGDEREKKGIGEGGR